MRRTGFTIVELLIVIVIIGILAAITIVAYSGVTNRAKVVTLQSDLQNSVAKLEESKINGDEKYPSNSDSLPKSKGTTLQYTLNSGPNSYCLTASTSGVKSYYVEGTGGIIMEGVCPNHYGSALDGWTSIDSGSYANCGVYAARAYCWGQDINSMLGNGPAGDVTSPTPVVTTGVLSGRTVTAVSAGTRHACAVADNLAFCWGSGTNGALGDGTTNTSDVPVAVNTAGVLAGKKVTAISAGSYYNTCAIADGQVFCWGYGGVGGLGNGTTSTSQTTPVAVSTAGVLAGKVIDKVAVGYQHVCVTASGKAYCWGNAQTSQLGNGDSSTFAQSTPVAVTDTGVLANKSITDINTFDSHTCVAASGQAFCWGRGTNGRLGNNTATTSAVPVAVTSTGVLSGKTVASVGVGVTHSCAIASGALYCWGQGSGAGVGDVAPYETLVPVTVVASGVLSGRTISMIDGGNYMSCARDTSGRGYCWGTSSAGTLGNGTTDTSQTAVLVTNP